MKNHPVLNRCLSSAIVCCLWFSVFSQPIRYGDNSNAGSYLSVRGIRIYVETYGTGTPLLFIHGNGGSIASFKNNIPFFAEHYRVIAADSRAQGKSRDAGDSLSFEMMADDEAALLDAMHIDSAYVVGWSDGGIVALLMAMRHPEKVIKLVSTGANLTPDSTAFAPGVWLDEKHYYDSVHLKKFSTATEKNDWKIFLLDWLQPNIPFTALSAIRCPAMIVAGDHDLISLEHTIEIYRHIPRSCLWIIPGSHHATVVEHRDEFDQKTLSFFSEPFKVLM